MTNRVETRFRIPRFPMLVLGFMAVVFPAAAAAPLDLESLRGYSVQKWSKNEGLPAHAVSAVAQTRDGYLWVGTDEGLVRFDGTRFTSFDADSATGLASSTILSLSVAGDGTLWIGTSEGLSSLDRGVFRRHGLKGEQIFALLSSRRGVLWAGTARGLFRSADGRHFESVSGALAEAEVRALSEDGTGGIWVGTGNAGLIRCREQRCARIGAPAVVSVRSLHPAQDSGMWVGTQAAGLFRVSDTSIERWTTRDGLANDSIYALREASDRTLWIGTNGGGVNRFRAGKFETARSTNAPALVRSLIEDREGNLWAGAVDGGLTRFARAQFTVLQASDGLAGDIVLPVYEAADGDLWLGTAGKGVSRLHRGKWFRYDTSNGLRSNVVLTIHGDDEGTIWIGTAGGGLARFRNGVFRWFTTSDGLRSDVVSAVLPARDGSLWIGTNGGGLHRMAGGRIERVGAWSLQSSILTLLEASDGSLWIGTESDGLGRLSKDVVTVIRRGREGLRSDTIHALIEDSAQAIWVGTYGGGLSRWKNGKLATITKAHGLSENIVQQILLDQQGFLWLAGNHGISRIRLDAAQAVADGRARRLQKAVFGTAHGLVTDETNGGIFPSAWQGRNGLLYFPTMVGLAVTDSRARGRREVDLHPVIEEVTTGPGRTITGPSGSIRIPPRTDRVEITYGAPTFSDPQATIYRYKLEGFDSEWVDAEKRRFAQYTGLPPGRYTFRVAAGNPEGTWSTSEAKLVFEVLPAFYQTNAFRAAASISVLLLALFIHRWLTRSLRRRHAALEELMNERAAAVEALHRSEVHFRTLIENASDLVMILSAEGAIRYVSPSSSRVLGRPAEDVLGLDIRSLVRIQDLESLHRTILGDLALGQIGTAQVQIPFVDMPARHLELVAQRLQFDHNGDQLIINCRDITQRKALEQRLEQANRISSLGRLAATVAHEFNNVLMSVSTMAEALAGAEPPAPRSRDLAQKISSAVRRGKRITDDILRFARDVEPAIEAVDLETWTPHLRSELRELFGGNFEIQVECAQPGLGIAADAQQLMQVFTNLALNARDAMPDGGSLTVCFDMATDTELSHLGFSSGPYIHAEVRDEGTGIPADVLPHIFEPLFTTKRGNGTGIGLAVVHQIVTRHGGHIAAATEAGHGTTFHIFLPSCVLPPADPAGSAQAALGEAGRLRILLVEDDPLVAEGLQMNLEILGADVQIVSLGRDVTAALAHSRPDAVLLDVGLPDMDGTAVFDEIERIDASLPVIFSTGHANVEMFDAYVHRSNVGFIRKPYDVAEVMMQLRALVRANGYQVAV